MDDITWAEAVLAVHILAGHPKCYTEKCRHLCRGLLESTGKRKYSPGIYCVCCARIFDQGSFESDAFNCDGTEIYGNTSV